MNVNPPFSNAADRRFPTSDERLQGFDCGPADRELFNGLFHRIEAELGAVILAAGITPSDDSLTQVRDAIQYMIDSATGGGDPASYLLLSQARARLPIFPDVQNADGRIGVSSPSNGTIRIAGGVNFLHRGIFPVTTVQQDLPVVASKIYHLRWNSTDGFVLRDLSSNAYNPNGLAEGNEAFDTGYDDMLVARIITNSSNIATITSLSNKVRMSADMTANGPCEIYTYGLYRDGGRFQNTFAINWGRRPGIVSVNGTSRQSGNPRVQGAANIIERSYDRYNVAAQVVTDWDTDLIAAGVTVVGTLNMHAYVG